LERKKASAPAQPGVAAPEQGRSGQPPAFGGQPVPEILSPQEKNVKNRLFRQPLSLSVGAAVGMSEIGDREEGESR